MADEKDKEAEGADDAPAKSGGGKLGMIMTIANIGLTAFLLVQVMGLGGKLEEVAKAAKSSGEEPEAKVKPIATLDPFVVNLNESGRARYLKAKFDLELKNQGAADKLEKNKVVVRDQVLRYLSSLDVKATLGEEGKDAIGDTIRKRIDETLGGKQINRLFFNEFVVQ